jgi:integrase/recombinase XerD
MSELQVALQEYLALRRALGFELRIAGRLLQRFVDFADAEKARFITLDLALRWACQPQQVQPAQWANRLSMVRRFAHYRHAADPRTEIPPLGLLPYRYQRKAPYLYRDEEIDQLLQAARQLPSPTGLRAATYVALLGLLIATGMRVSEPIALDRTDVDWQSSALTIRRTKFGKARWLPVHPSTCQALQRYATTRDRLVLHPTTPSFFLSETGTRLTTNTVQYTFARLSQRIGLRRSDHNHGPRLHDFRHRFAIQTLLHWYRTGVDVEQRLPLLAAYLGHAHINDTYWYLSSTPELLHLAAQRVAPHQNNEEFA